MMMKYYILILMLLSLEACKKKAVSDFIVLSNGKGLRAQFTPYGARLVSLSVPGKDGRPVNVVWGFDRVDDYRKCTSNPYYGAIIGRYANRIAGGRFTLDGKTYQLDQNDHGNSLHGGAAGLHGKDWQVGLLSDTSVTFSCLSKDGEGGYPGNLTVSVTYTLTSMNALKIDYRAMTDKATVVNLTNHAFWNLNGPGGGTIIKHQVYIRADRYTPVDSLLIPTGALDSVRGTSLDFCSYPRKISVRIDEHDPQLLNGKGYDHNYVLKAHGRDTVVARVTGDRSGIVLSVTTDEPGLQFYTGNFMAGRNRMNGGAWDLYRSGLCLETQHFPDSPNKQGFPSTILRPGQTYRSSTSYQFSLLQDAPFGDR
jgi:aldose 1-epimerase